MYLLGIIVAITTAFVLSKLDGSKAEHALLIELPEYKSPNARTIAIYVWEKVKDYLTKAGTVIFVASVILWGLLNFGPSGYVTDISNSFGSIIGKAYFILYFAPVGLGYWQIVVALIAGIAAKEVVVSSCSVLFEVQNITTTDGMSTMGCNARRSWIRGSKCLCTDGILPSLYPVYCYHRNDQPGSRAKN